MIIINGLDLTITKDTTVTVVAVSKEGVSICDGTKVAVVETDLKLAIGDLLKLDPTGEGLVVAKQEKKAAEKKAVKRNPSREELADWNVL